jgi:hypothetical protein
MDSNSKSFGQSELIGLQVNIAESLGGRRQHRYRFRRNRVWNSATADRNPADIGLATEPAMSDQARFLELS